MEIFKTEFYKSLKILKITFTIFFLGIEMKNNRFNRYKHYSKKYIYKENTTILQCT